MEEGQRTGPTAPQRAPTPRGFVRCRDFATRDAAPLIPRLSDPTSSYAAYVISYNVPRGAGGKVRAPPLCLVSLEITQIQWRSWSAKFACPRVLTFGINTNQIGGRTKAGGRGGGGGGWGVEGFEIRAGELHEIVHVAL